LYFLHPGTLTLSPDRQRVLMSEITNDGLTRSHTGCVIAVRYKNSFFLSIVTPSCNN